MVELEALDVVALTRSLLGIPSVTGEEGEVGLWVAEQLAARGWSVKKQEVPSEVGREHPPRWNILAQVAEASGPPDVVLTTHLDTVPPHIPMTEDEDFIYGRGTCDAKGIFAAQWVAAEQLRAEGHTSVALLGICGEETDSIGAKVAHELLPQARWIIDGEPTELELSSGAKGILAIQLEASGKAGHSAYPEVGRSATHLLIGALSKAVTAQLPSVEKFGATTVNVGVLKGGVAPNVIAPAASAQLMIRLGAPAEQVLAALQAILAPELADGLKLVVTSQSEPHEIHVPQGRSGQIVRFGSDVPYLSKIGTPLLVGPGSIHDAHTRHEKVGKRALADAVALYAALARELCA